MRDMGTSLVVCAGSYAQGHMRRVPAIPSILAARSAHLCRAEHAAGRELRLRRARAPPRVKESRFREPPHAHILFASRGRPQPSRQRVRWRRADEAAPAADSCELPPHGALPALASGRACGRSRRRAVGALCGRALPGGRLVPTARLRPHPLRPQASCLVRRRPGRRAGRGARRGDPRPGRLGRAPLQGLVSRGARQRVVERRPGRPRSLGARRRCPPPARGLLCRGGRAAARARRGSGRRHHLRCAALRGGPRARGAARAPDARHLRALRPRGPLPLDHEPGHGVAAPARPARARTACCASAWGRAAAGTCPPRSWASRHGAT